MKTNVVIEHNGSEDYVLIKFNDEYTIFSVSGYNHHSNQVYEYLKRIENTLIEKIPFDELSIDRDLFVEYYLSVHTHKIKCLGGGTLEINNELKEIKTHSKSFHYGIAPESVLEDILKKHFPEFTINVEKVDRQREFPDVEGKVQDLTDNYFKEKGG